MGVYILSSSAISPQNTFLREDYLKPLDSIPGDTKESIEPEYKNFINPRLLRRMARIIKMGVATASVCLQRADIEQPQAITIGTGLGCLDDTEKFLSSIVPGDGGPLSPTPFIQSTHNTIAGQISLLLNCHAYSTTFAQRGHSFENALHDGLMQIYQGVDPVLVGGIDELTSTSTRILRELNCGVSELQGEKIVMGEGASFFLISGEKSRDAVAEIVCVETLYNPSDSAEVSDHIVKTLEEQGLSIDEIDGVFLGVNGSIDNDEIYQSLANNIFSQQALYSFKNLCGEYFTSIAFGVEIGANMLKNQQEYEGTIIRKSSKSTFKNILIYNHFNGKYHTVILLRQCLDS